MPYENGVWRAHRWEDWEIELIDGSLNTIGLLDEAAQVAISWALYGYGEGSLALHIGSTLAAYLQDAGVWFLRFYRDGQYVRDFMIAKDDRGYTLTTQHTDEYMQIALVPLDQILKNHLCLPQNGTGTFAAPTMPVDDAFKWIVDYVCGPHAYQGPGGQSRAISGLTIAANESKGANETITQAHKMDLFEFLQKYGPTWGVDWRVRLEQTTGIANQMVFETFYPARGLDKSADNGVRQPVILDDASGETLSARRYRPGVGFANVVIGKSMKSEVRDNASIALYGRREILADTDEAKRLNMLLRERRQRLGDEYEFSESEMVEVGAAAEDAQPGDTVTLGNQHLAIPYREEMIREIKFLLADDGREGIKIIFGEYEKTLADKLDEARGGGGGSGSSFYYDPVRGLKDDAGVFVPFSNDDDYNWVKLNTDEHLSATSDPLNNEIMLALDDAPEFAVPAIKFGATPAEGVATTFIRSDGTIKLVFAGDSGTAVPNANNTLTVSGSGGISVSGSSNTLTITGPGVTGFATPAITFGAAHAAGSATTVIRSDATIKLVFAGETGTAVPSSSNTLTIAGTGYIHAVAGTNTVTISGAHHHTNGFSSTDTSSESTHTHSIIVDVLDKTGGEQSHTHPIVGNTGTTDGHFHTINFGSGSPSTAHDHGYYKPRTTSGAGSSHKHSYDKSNINVSAAIDD